MKIACPKCGKEIDDSEFFCPYCNCPIEIEEEVEEQEESTQENEPQKQSGFGIASFVLAVVAFSLFVGRHSISGWAAVYVSEMLHMWQNILIVIAFIFGVIGMFSKNRKSGFAVAGNIISFILFWI